MCLTDLDGGEHGVGLGDYADDDGTLLDGFLGIFDLEDTTLRRAGETEVSGDGGQRIRSTNKVTESLS